jgi:glutathione S-transferase
MAKPITIYGRILSPYVARVVLAAKAKGFKYDLTLPTQGLKSPAFLKMNPFGKIPVLKDGKTVVYESSVIVEYLESKSRAKKLVPSSAKAAGLSRMIGAVSAEYVMMAGVKLFRHKRGILPNLDVQATIAELYKGLDVLEKVLIKGKYAAGPKFSIADVYAVPSLFFALKVSEVFNISDLLAKRPKIAKYWGVLQKDKISKPVIDDMSAMLVDALEGRLPVLK